ncbi:MAG: hypothetical protein JRJ12_07080 [Deltaproteobacteria bacterium]|nr:hypothetical protein [Deltaproteobacteria bacterium]MBW2071132.1 hypothetical protein [Deltaproteobacteria bacterium]
MPLLDRVNMHLLNIECMPTSTKFNAIIDLPEDISELLPYLAAEIRGCTYIHGHDELNYMEEGHIVAIRPRQITVTAVKSESEARKICDCLRNLINDVHDRKESITPVLRKQARLGPLAVFKELPGTNCGDCGEPTCLAFAAAVVSRKSIIKRCEPLFLPERTPQRRRLLQLLTEAEYDIE